MANQGINTGTGGINIDSDVYGMDVGVPDAEGGPQGQWSGGDVAVDKTVKDISKPTKETFAKYMSKTTLGLAGSSTHPNAYPVGKGEGTTVQNYSIKTAQGLPQPLSETSNEAKFGSVGVGLPTVQPDFLKKGLSAGSGVDGNKLLPEAAIQADAGGPYIKNAKDLNEKQKVHLSEVIKKNRFSPSTNFDVDSYLVLPNNLKLGISPAEQEALGEVTKGYTYEQLAHVGTILQLAATGEYAVVLNDDPNIGADKINPDDPLVAISTLLPGLGQLGAGAPLPTEYLKVEKIVEKVPDNPVTAEQLTDFNTKYEGVINSSFEKFSGFSSLGMSALVATLAIAIVAAFTGLGQLFRVGSEASPLNTQIQFSKKLGLGNSTGYKTTGYPEDLVSLIASIGQGSAMEFFGILKTRSNFSNAVKAGVQATFGLDSNFSPRLTFESSGYLVTIARSIVRAVSAIVLQFIEIGQLIGGAVNTGSSANVDDIFAKTLELISSIKNSRFIKCFNVFSQIGDTSVFNLLSQEQADVSDPVKDSGKKISFVEFFPDVNESGSDFLSAVFYGKSRMTDPGNKGALKLVWATNRTPDAFILPVRTDLFSQIPGIGSPILKINDRYNRSKNNAYKFIEGSQGFRISADKVREIEDKFEGEYLPFYIHDIRTNEILGFHAFLTNLTDEYTANYDSVEGIGRIEPVKIYKSTTRRLGVGFVLAALDKLDFDSMWEKINKLTTMVYPQYTKGKVLNSANGNYVFEKPFTQMIGASPMVRLRIGNLFTSNYSKFNIAGIFGLKSPDTKLNGVEFLPTDLAEIPDEKIYAPGNTFLLNIEGGIPRADLSAVYDNQYYNGIITATIIKSALGTADIAAGDVTAAFFVELGAIKPNQFASIDYKTVDYKAREFELLQLGDRNAFIANTLWIVTKSQLTKPDDETFKRIYVENAAQFATEASTFLNEDNNVITRSFKSAGGRGIAGFIDNISFDWNNTTWDVDVGRKAPKMCRVTMGFTPIHDISPGIDANGFNRAPIYPLGPFARKDRG